MDGTKHSNIEPVKGDALIIVDVQYDFLPGGALAVAELGVDGVRRHDHLDEVQLGAETLGEVGGPADRQGGCLRQVSPDHDASDGPGPEVEHIRHARIIDGSEPGQEGWPACGSSVVPAPVRFRSAERGVGILAVPPE